MGRFKRSDRRRLAGMLVNVGKLLDVSTACALTSGNVGLTMVLAAAAATTRVTAELLDGDSEPWS